MKAKIRNMSTCLWFDRQAEEAARHYVSIFENSRINKIRYYSQEGYEIHGMQEGTVMTVDFELDGNRFEALNGGPIFKFNEAISLVVVCDTQEQVDYFWEKLGEGGDPKARQCGWIKDKFGLSWQIVPQRLNELLDDPDPVKADRVMGAMLRMKKLEIAGLEDAYAGELLDR